MPADVVGDVVQLHCQLRDDTEHGAGAAHGSQELRIVLRTCRHLRVTGCDENTGSSGVAQGEVGAAKQRRQRRKAA